MRLAWSDSLDLSNALWGEGCKEPDDRDEDKHRRAYNRQS